MRKGNKVTVTSSKHGGFAVKLNGERVPCLVGFSLNLQVGEANVATFRVLADEVEIDAEALAILEATIAQSAPNKGPTHPIDQCPRGHKVINEVTGPEDTERVFICLEEGCDERWSVPMDFGQKGMA